MENYKRILDLIQNADKLLIGASNGLSISEGIHIFADNADFRENFSEFRDRHGIPNIIQGCFYPFPQKEEQWGFNSRMYSYFNKIHKSSIVMENLLALVKEKNYFVVTSNIDAHFLKAGFCRERVFEIEGNCCDIQCASACHEQVYPAGELLTNMALEQKDGRVPEELIPVCPKCGGAMRLHIEVDRNFVRDPQWKEKAEAYRSFAEISPGENILLLEFGVGLRNRMIKAPFMEYTSRQANATYVTFNKGELFIPREIASRSLGVEGNIAKILADLVLIRSEIATS